MWTPKRVIILVAGMAIFLGFYLGYAWFLGTIDGLPPLPGAFTARAKEALPPLPARPASRVVTRLQLAFGQDCPETARQIKIELNSRSMVFAADHFQVEPDGRVKLSPISVVLFNKDKSDGKSLEINTIRGEVAFLKFDRPIAHLTDIGNRKVIGGEISGKIEVVNNRKTSSRDDDLFIFIPQGPLYYLESKQLVWTQDAIHLTDNQSKPRPTEIHGQGMEMELLTNNAKPVGPPASKPKSDSIAGVKRIKLLSNVDMHLYVDNGSSFLGATQTKPNSANTREKAHIGIKTLGTFEYLLQKEGDVALFDACIQPGTPVRDVLVTRHHVGKSQIDQLTCEKLEIKMRRKDSTGPEAGLEKEEKSLQSGIDIQSARATGKEVVLTSDEEKLEAHGNDFYYEAKTSTAILKGSPEMWALKEGNLLHALEMSIQDQKADPKIPGTKGFQKAVAKGPGWIDIKEKDKKDHEPVRASWKDQLISNREDNMDVLTLIGDAKFLDPGHDQQLSGDSIKVWLKSPEAQKPEMNKDGNPAPSPSMGKRLHRVEATGNVSADSKDLIIRDSGRLAVWFKNMQVENAIPTSNPLPGGTKVGATNAINQNPQEKPPTSPIPNNFSLDQGKANNQSENKKPRPIHLNARSIEAWVQQVNNKNKVEKLWTEGSVSVKQDSEKPGEKGVDVKGDTLQLTAHPEGNFLVVTGDLAQLRMDHMFIVGPEVNIDQSTNKAWVNGVGAMQMESTTNFQGNKLGKAVPLEVHWNKSMFFNGKFAEFHGGIQAEQENSRLACQSLQVFFDKAVSLKGGNNREKTDTPARVQNLVCDRTVRVEEIIRENDKIQKYHRIQAVTLSMNKLDKDEEDTKPGSDGNEVRASGPGEVRILQKSGTETFLSPNANEGSQPAGKSPTKDPDGEMKLTQVSFLRSMYGNSKTNTATFLENVRVLNFPCENPNIDIDLESVMDNLPKGGMFLRADRLDVLSKQDSKGKSQQEMRAKGRVLVHAQEFWGRAEQVSYEEAKDLVIFHGGDTGVATLYKRVRQGAPPEEIKGKKITYNRLSGQFKIDEGRWLNGGSN